MAKPPKTPAPAAKRRAPRKAPVAKPAAPAPKKAVRARPATPLAVPAPTPSLAPRHMPLAAPASRPPVRMPPPPRRAGPSPYKAVALTAVLLFVLGLGLFFAVSMMRPKAAEQAASVAAALPVAIGDNDAFTTWLARWKGVEPYVNRAEFETSSDAAFTLDPGPTGTPSLDDLRAPRSNRYVWSKDGTRFVDYLSKYPDDGALTVVYGRQGASYETLSACGGGCIVEKAFWTGPSTFTLLGREPATGKDGAPLCIDAQDGSGRRCYERLWAAWYDLDAMRVKRFVSSPHVFSTHPADDDRRSLWASGLSADEQVAAGAIPQAYAERMIGMIAVMSPNGASFTVDGGEFGMEAVKIVGATRIRDEHGNPAQFTYLRHGMSVDVSGERAEGPLLIASDIAVTKAPAVLVTEPQTTAIVHATFGLVGAARASAFPLGLTLADKTTGRTLRSASIKKPAGATGEDYADFVQEMTLSRLGLKAGQGLTFTVAPKAGDPVILDLTYQP